jgi:predicted Kef-type K+ transport protein
MDLFYLFAAFILGFGATRFGLPPLVGYLAAGFVLAGFGQETTPLIELIADWGILLLLFGIGLKLRVRSLARPEVWGVAGIHMVVATGFLGLLFLVLGVFDLPLVGGIGAGEAALVGFAFSFSSTVFAVQALEERSETSSVSGRIAVGILIVQDLVAVVFLTASAGELPSLWAVPAVAAVLAARPVYGWLLDRVGHGELLTLLGFFLAIGVGARLFEEVGLKADLGALLVGVMLAGHARAPELSDRLLGFKDLLLIGFFLSIGLAGLPGPAAVGVAVLVVALLPLKAGGYLGLITRFHLRPRTAWHTAVTLATFSEFGLIVLSAGAEEGLIDERWITAGALAVAASFAIAAPANQARYRLYRRWSKPLDRLERPPVLAEDALIEPDDARILVFGMGRVGTGAYDELVKREGEVVLGVEREDALVTANRSAGRRIVRGDALDRDFWERVRLHPGIDLVVLAMSRHVANLEAVARVREFLPEVAIAATASYPDQVVELEEAGVDVARNLYGEAGQGLADDACDLIIT